MRSIKYLVAAAVAVGEEIQTIRDEPPARRRAATTTQAWNRSPRSASGGSDRSGAKHRADGPQTAPAAFDASPVT